MNTNLESEIEKGQVWEYRSRPGEESSSLTVIDVEDIGVGVRVIHVALDGLKRKSKQTGKIKEWFISHTPIDQNVLKPSLIKVISHKSCVINEGLQYWREEYKKGEAGVWSVDITMVIDITEESLK
jgi:hypothetical protein